MRLIIRITMLFLVHKNLIQAQNHPKLILTQESVNNIRQNLNSLPILSSSFKKIKEDVDAEIKKGIDVPVPKDMAGGYTHQTHKKNYITLQKAGIVFQILKDSQYALYIRDMLLQYAKIYNTLPLHPEKKSYARGKLFWQCLNDANWLVYVSQAYDCIYDWLPSKVIQHLEQQLFIPFAKFLSYESPQFFNRIHNHSTWGVAAVGMIGLVMKNEELVKIALYGLNQIPDSLVKKDNDGGSINDKNNEAGFFKNIDYSFSPDGYYTEGPYYQRYSIYPFLVFAHALQNNKPELNIFEYKNAILIKSVYTLLNLTDSKGNFFPVNDAQKGMSVLSNEIVHAVDIAYYYGNKNPQLLSVAKLQQSVILDNAGFNIAQALQNFTPPEPIIKSSIEISDGQFGNEGAIGILRTNSMGTETNLVMKYTKQGMGHGHYDKLSFSLYKGGNEIIQDYGAARYVNIEQKDGGGYLQENFTWAKQSIAHNTIVQDETSHFNADYDVANLYHANNFFFNSSNPDFQIMSAFDSNAYKGTFLHRTMALIKDDIFEYPIVLDIFEVKSDTKHNYDLPFYYLGQIMYTNFKYQISPTLYPLGNKHGYQHLWLEASALINNSMNAQFTWLNNQSFHTITTLTQKNDQILLARIGANDSFFNLRRDPTLILRRQKDTSTFVSIIENHGFYSPVDETAINSYSTIKSIKIFFESNQYVGVYIQAERKKQKAIFEVIISKLDNNPNTAHRIDLNNKIYKWTGTYYFDKYFY